MLEKIGLAALVILVATESFAFCEAVLLALEAFLHLGSPSLMTGATLWATGLAIVLGLAAGFWIYRRATLRRL